MLLQQDRESWTNDFGSGGAGGEERCRFRSNGENRDCGGMGKTADQRGSASIVQLSAQLTCASSGKSSFPPTRYSYKFFIFVLCREHLSPLQLLDKILDIKSSKSFL